jgi:hypothetical protein
MPQKRIVEDLQQMYVRIDEVSKPHTCARSPRYTPAPLRVTHVPGLNSFRADSFTVIASVISVCGTFTKGRLKRMSRTPATASCAARSLRASTYRWLSRREPKRSAAVRSDSMEMLARSVIMYGSVHAAGAAGISVYRAIFTSAAHQ